MSALQPVTSHSVRFGQVYTICGKPDEIVEFQRLTTDMAAKAQKSEDLHFFKIHGPNLGENEQWSVITTQQEYKAYKPLLDIYEKLGTAAQTYLAPFTAECAKLAQEAAQHLETMVATTPYPTSLLPGHVRDRKGSISDGVTMLPLKATGFFNQLLPANTRTFTIYLNDCIDELKRGRPFDWQSGEFISW